MKFLNEDDKEFFAIIGGILFIVIGFSVAIFTTVRTHEATPQKHYDLECLTNYVKYPLQECVYKEVKWLDRN